MSIRLYVCEDCGTHTTDDPHRLHTGHHVVAIEGDDYDQLVRLAAWHIPFARKHRGLPPIEVFPPPFADWNSDEDAEYDQIP